MPDARSPIRHHLVLYQRAPEQGRARFFSLMIERNLFGTIRLVRNWGLVGSKGKGRSGSSPMKLRPLRHWRRGPQPSGKRAIRTSDALSSALLRRYGKIQKQHDRHARAWRGLVRLLPAQNQGSRNGRPVLSFGRTELQKQMGCQ
jgi:hypothetical protein